MPAGHSGARLVTDGLDAFALRALTARSAVTSVDVQYYIWHSDVTGRVLVQELLQAADRGVRLRVLLDDMDARSRDSALVTLDRHRHVEVRLFNPFATRSGVLRTLSELFVRGSRLNRRMHNKAWIVDGRLAIVGGRNIGDEYFTASEDVNFVDTDVLLAGPAVEEAARHFEAYWSNAASIPVARLRRVAKTRLKLEEVRRRLEVASRAAVASAFGQRLQASLDEDLTATTDVQFEWSRRVDVVADDPCKANPGTRRIAPGVLESMTEAFDAAQSELLLISPYFVPGAGGAARLSEVVRRGAQVSVLTNSLAATDVAAVHSGYARYRSTLLAAGVRLYEMKEAVSPLEHDKRMRLGSSRASLHTKAAIVDRRRIFVGSFNLDPRSASLNCEMGAWIDSEPLARRMLEHFAAATRPEKSYSVSLDGDGRPRWMETVDGVRWSIGGILRPAGIVGRSPGSSACCRSNRSCNAGVAQDGAMRRPAARRRRHFVGGPRTPDVTWIQSLRLLPGAPCGNPARQGWSSAQPARTSGYTRSHSPSAILSEAPPHDSAVRRAPPGVGSRLAAVCPRAPPSFPSSGRSPICSGRSSCALRKRWIATAIAIARSVVRNRSSGSSSSPSRRSR